MKKIFIEKEEPIAEIIEAFLDAEDDEVMLVIPRGSRITESRSNFRLLAREAEATGKKVVIESVDDEVRSYASLSGITASHPLFETAEKPHRSISDIVAHGKHPKKVHGENIQKKTAAEKQKEKKDREEEDGSGSSGEEWRIAGGLHDRERTPDREDLSVVVVSKRERKLLSRFRLTKTVFIVGAIFLAAGTLWISTGAFAKARVTIQLKKIPWEYESVVTADVARKTTELSLNAVPAQLLRMEKNVTQMFPATGKSSVSEKASGMITVYNTFSSDPQPLVATTRFLTGDGKLFRLDQKTIIPGAEIKDGKIIPSSIKARVTADKPGEEYNIGPATDRITIPGFKGTPRYDGFYGVFEERMSGGFIGVKAVPTEADKTQAIAKVQDMLRAAFEALFLKSVPEELAVLLDAASFEIGKLTVSERTDENGNFSVLGSALFRAVAFREEDVRSILYAQAGKVYPNPAIRNLSIAYGGAKPDFLKGTLSVNIKASGVLTPSIQEGDLKAQLLGKRQKEAGDFLRTLPDLTSARISFWPIWVRRMPGDVEQISVSVE